MNVQRRRSGTLPDIPSGVQNSTIPGSREAACAGSRRWFGDQLEEVPLPHGAVVSEALGNPEFSLL